MKLWRFLFIALVLFVTLFAAFYFLRNHADGQRSGVLSPTAWQRMASPGALSEAHAFLEHNCAACHTSVEGVEASNCIVCHANNKSLLGRQPTAFHANVNSCRECHREHRGTDRRPTDMDHLALSKIGFRQLEADHSPNGANELVRKELLDWINQHQSASVRSKGDSSITPQETVLNCTGCHSTKDRHNNLFGQDCAQCHGTTKWTISEFRHPSPNSKECAQCHQANKCHYMTMCFSAMTKVARQPSSKVNQCYDCHQTTAWTVIKGLVGNKDH
jgi:hypothetical protein